MSAPALVGCVAAALCLGVPVMAAGSHLVAAQEITGAADAAALAAADTLTGWLDGDACDRAAQVAAAAAAEVELCTTAAARGEARIVLVKRTPLGQVMARARAGGVQPSEPDSSTGRWSWPAVSGGVTQGFHDGFAIDLAAPVGSPLFAPFDGEVVAVGPDGGAIPPVCLARPDWWRGENETVIIRHEYNGRQLFSSHNHIAPGSAHQFGIEVGSRVLAGEPVALAGMSGCTSGPHTHFTLSTSNTNVFPDVDPFRYLTPP